jgi:hypothetical protein
MATVRRGMDLLWSAIRSAHSAIRMFESVLVVLVSRGAVEKRKQQVRWQQAIDACAIEHDNVDKAIERLGFDDDLDTRIEVLLERPGSYTTAYNIVDSAPIFGAFSDQDAQLAGLTARARIDLEDSTSSMTIRTHWCN